MNHPVFEKQKDAIEYALILNQFLGKKAIITEQYFLEGKGDHLSLETFYTVTETELDSKLGNKLVEYVEDSALPFKHNEYKNFHKYTFKNQFNKLIIKIYKKGSFNQVTKQHMVNIKYQVDNAPETHLQNISLNRDCMLTKTITDSIAEGIRKEFAEILAKKVLSRIETKNVRGK